jgi:DNA-binding response OmpR family regulator
VLRVLVVEDDTVLADLIAKGLREDGMIVDVVHDGVEAVSRASDVAPDVIVLDRDLPVLHGDDVTRALIRQGSPARVLMLTAAASIGSRVEGLLLGADDYLAKPFAFAELIARIRALGRRSAPPLPPVLERAGVSLDPARRIVTRAGRPVDLTPKEFAVLEVLMRGQGTVVSAEHLLEKAWDENIDPFTNVVRVTMMTLRKKLGEPQVIETVPGAGYRL